MLHHVNIDIEASWLGSSRHTHKVSLINGTLWARSFSIRSARIALNRVQIRLNLLIIVDRKWQIFTNDTQRAVLRTRKNLSKKIEIFFKQNPNLSCKLNFIWQSLAQGSQGMLNQIIQTARLERIQVFLQIGTR